VWGVGCFGGESFLFTVLVGGWAWLAPCGVELPAVDGVGAVVLRGANRGLFGWKAGWWLVDCLCAAQASLYQHSIQSWGFLLNVVGQRWGLSASDALLALLSIFSGRRFRTSQPYSPLGWGHSFVVSSVALLTVADGVSFCR
jgi:hypothetical protein